MALTDWIREPWGIRITRTAEGTLEVRIDELPEYIAVGADEQEFEAEVWDSLRSLLMAYLAAGYTIPMPNRRRNHPRAPEPIVWRLTPGAEETPPSGMSFVSL